MISACLVAIATISAQADGSGAPAPDPLANQAVARPSNPDALQRRLGVEGYRAKGDRRFTIAVFDSGFTGWDRPHSGLPRDVRLVDKYEDEFVTRNQLGDPSYHKPLTEGNIHGRQMAQVAAAVAGADPQAPRFLLLNANGPTMFRRAVRLAIEERVDIILFSGAFEGAGNFDGNGPINRSVAPAIAAGILWINASGNYGGAVANAPIRLGTDGQVLLGPGPQRGGLRLRNRLDENSITITLTWNDYRDQEDAGTSKDLDLFLEDDTGRVLAKSELRQITGTPASGEETRNPRERVVLPEAARGNYRIKVRAKSSQFDANDRLRVLVTAARSGSMADPATGRSVSVVELRDATADGEIFPPADHRDVVTVGDASASASSGPTSDRRVKPEIVLAESQVRWSNGEETGGTSNAAALFAGAAARLWAAAPTLTAAEMRRILRAKPRPSSTTFKPWTPRPLAELEATSAWPFVQYLRRGDVGTVKRWQQGNDGPTVLSIGVPPADLGALFPTYPADRLRRAAGRYSFWLALRPSGNSYRVVDLIVPDDRKEEPPPGSVRVILEPGRVDPKQAPVPLWKAPLPSRWPPATTEAKMVRPGAPAR